MSINRLLIANRGEIAVRIARTAHRLGISTVGVYSEPDAVALHADSVDVAIALGGATAAESYLRADLILRAALDSGCDAVHPGYGFLAENADFAQQVLDAGLVWVGPTPEQIRLLGDKVAAKRAAVAVGVPTTEIIEVSPGAVPEGVPMPALVKAAAGGGGRGMRVVQEIGELPTAIEAAAREAESAFGDGTVFIEPYIEHGRHIEVQIVGDSHGNVIHLGERECSIQRRNQKVIEESPSPGISDETRDTLCDGAVRLARSVGYQNAGTVEYLVGDDGSISFLEVNTRLQVEHPVTEEVTGLDLVELQLQVAAGEPLPIGQADVVPTGHAIEVRLVAENPRMGWLPATGLIDRFDIAAGVRVDTGYRGGAEVSVNYDSLLAKIVAQAPTREQAGRSLARVLRASQISGVDTNLHMLIATLTDPDFLGCDTPTSYLDGHPDVVVARGPSGEDRIALLLGAVFAHERVCRERDTATGFAPSGWRNLMTIGQRQRWVAAGDRTATEVVMCHDRAEVLIGEWPGVLDDGSLAEDTRRRLSVRILDRRRDAQVLEVDRHRYVIETAVDATIVHTRAAFGSLRWELEPRFEVHDTAEIGGGPICPLPGTVIAVHVSAGEQVAEGQTLMVVEAMKMEHQITAVAPATVTEVRFAVGDRVDAGDLLVAMSDD